MPCSPRLVRPLILLASVALLVSAPTSARDLTLDERIEAQRAIDRVYHSHLVGGTAPFEVIAPRSAAEKKVRAYLERSAALEHYWHRPVTAEALEREWERIVRGSAFPGRLEEIYAALDHDPVRIAECFVRPALVGRLADGFFDKDERIHGAGRRSWPSWWAEQARELRADVERTVTVWRDSSLASIPAGTGGECPLDDTWDNGPFEEIPDHTTGHTTVWTGSEMLVWGGVTENRISYPNGLRYDPLIDDWRRITKNNAPESRTEHTAVWTGTEMIVWGGRTHNGAWQYLDNGRRYDPVTDLWHPMSRLGAPSARGGHTAIWTGSEMLIWGGWTGTSASAVATGGRYDPATDLWQPMSSSGAPSARVEHTAIWTGSEMLIWGGWTGTAATVTASGARYVPSTNVWSAIPTTGAPVARTKHSAVWTGTEMMVWGGRDVNSLPLATGGLFHPGGSTWTSTSLTNAAAARDRPSAVWTGDEVLIWGGCCPFDTGRFYDPATNTWGAATSTTNVPQARWSHSAVWTGDLFIVWGGESSAVQFTGGRYDPSEDTWTPTSTGGAAGEITEDSRWFGEPLWTGNEILFLSYSGPGYAYDAVNDTGRVIAASGRSGEDMRIFRPQIWTGQEAILWGSAEGQTGLVPGRGLRYNPLTDSWSTMSISAVTPLARTRHAMVWTGDRLIVWGGEIPGTSDPYGNGGVYNPATDVWEFRPSVVNSPYNRLPPSNPPDDLFAFWDGDEMIVYIGDPFPPDTSNPPRGGRYRLSTNTWGPMSLVGAVRGPKTGSRWTGNDMLVLPKSFTGAGGRYNPAADAWTPMAPSLDGDGWSNAAIVWTGTNLLNWGGAGTQSATNLGTRYNPTHDSWFYMSLPKAPEPRNVRWSLMTDGFAVIGGGGFSLNSSSRDGGRYVVNPDTEGDGVPELCDNCPGVANSDQGDADVDNHGDACDACTDTDGDTFGNPGYPANTCAGDNCPTLANAGQDDADADGAGDVCDSCTDVDFDGAGNPGYPANTCAADNCPVVSNAYQRDTDTDGVGDLCDVCPDAADASQDDLDADGAGDACDCQPADPSDRRPPDVSSLIADRVGSETILLSWSAAPGADAYSITRGSLGAIGPGQYGNCLVEGVAGTSHADPVLPAPGEGLAYLVQAQNYECGLGILGRDGQEQEIVNGSPGACAGAP